MENLCSISGNYMFYVMIKKIRWYDFIRMFLLPKGRKNCHELNTNFPLIIFAQLTYYNIQSLLA